LTDFVITDFVVHASNFEVRRAFLPMCLTFLFNLAEWLEPNLLC
jgi:hypothetical protein